MMFSLFPLIMSEMIFIILSNPLENASTRALSVSPVYECLMNDHYNILSL